MTVRLAFAQLLAIVVTVVPAFASHTPNGTDATLVAQAETQASPDTGRSTSAPQVPAQTPESAYGDVVRVQTCLAQPRPDLVGAKSAAESALRRTAEADRRYWPLALINLATIARLQGHTAQAFAHLDVAAGQLADRPDSDPLTRMSRCQWHAERGACFLVIGVLDRAEEDFARQTELAKVGHPTERIAASINAVNLRLAQANHDAALREAKRALAMPEVASHPKLSQMFRGRELCARAYRAADQDEGKEAQAAIADAIEGFITKDHETLDVNLRARLRFDAVRAYIRAGQPERAERLLAPPLPEGELDNPDHALDAAALRAHGLLQRGAPAQVLRVAQTSLLAELGATYANFRREAPRLGGVGLLEFQARKDALVTLLAMDDALDRENGAEQAVTHLDEALAIGSLTRQLGGEPVIFAQVRDEVVQKDGGLLMCVYSPLGGVVLAVDHAGSELQRFAVDPRLVHDLRALEDGLHSPPEGDHDAAINRLRSIGQSVKDRLLPQSVQARMRKWRTLHLVTAGQFDDAAWNALPWDDSWLCLRFGIVHTPSLAAALSIRRRQAERAAPARQLDFAVLGDAEHSADAERWGLRPLQLTDAERASLIAAGRSRGWFGAQASADTLLSDEFAAARAWCIVTHGVQDYRREQFAGLLLSASSRGDTLFADDLRTALCPPIVVLAVCGSAASHKRRGDESSAHIGGTMMVRGADAIVLASGNLSVGATLQLVAGLEHELVAGRSVAEATRRARTTISAMPHRAHPHFFAGLRVLGIDRALR